MHSRIGGKCRVYTVIRDIGSRTGRRGKLLPRRILPAPLEYVAFDAYECHELQKHHQYPDGGVDHIHPGRPDYVNASLPVHEHGHVR